MLLLKHILVATDFSPTSLVALREALRIASRCRSTVSFIYVVDACLYSMAPDGIPTAVDWAERESEVLLNQLRAEGLLKEATPEFTITVGPVWPVINSMIREQGAELLVLGTHARSGLPKFVLGSVAESAFREAKCAVMTVGPHARKGRGSGDPPEHLLVPTDLSFESSNALRYGVSLATAIGSHVTLLNVLSRNGHSHPEQEMRKHLAESINEHARSTTMVSRRAEYGSPASTILAVAGQLDSELIVMGLEAWSDRPTPMWRTAYEIVLRARCPVLSMRTPARTASDA